MRIHSVLFVSLLLLVVLAVVPRTPSFVATDHCTMKTLDIGQGDAILFTTSDHRTILFDGGPGNSILDALGRSLPPGTLDLDLIVATHPDADHLGGLVPVLQQYRVHAVLTTGVAVTTQLYQRWTKALEEEQAHIYHAQAGQRVTIGDHFQFEELWPEKDFRNVLWTEPSKNGIGGTNDTGIGGRVTCDGSTVMMTADLSHDVEEQLARNPEMIRSSLLKVGHHGSRYSSSQLFLQAVHPTLAVIPVGKKNRYGHPHPTVIDRLTRLDIPFLRTDELGDIVLVSKGDGTWVKK